MNGYLGLILTGHVPYLRSADRDPHGEEALHETIAQAIVPTLNALFDLRELGLRPSLALAYSPLLLEQLSDGAATARPGILGGRGRGASRLPGALLPRLGPGGAAELRGSLWT